MTRRCASQLILIVLLLAVGGCRTVSGQNGAPGDVASGLRYWSEVRTTPRPLRLHFLAVDLAAPNLEVVTVLADDPDGDGDGDGEAEAVLTHPLTLAETAGALALVNANAFCVVPARKEGQPHSWVQGMRVNIGGLAASAGQVRSPPQPQYIGFWIARDGTPHLGAPADTALVRDGVAGFGWLMRDGAIVCGPTGPRHPRTAIGLDKARKRLWLVVVDGRQSGYSEGMTTYELAGVMRDLGCHEAVNLDGGGSSVMVVQGKDGVRRVMNRPSTRFLGKSLCRPIPTALVVRRRP